MIYILIALCLCVCWLWYNYNRSSGLEPPALSGGLPIVGHSFLAVGDGIHTYRIIERLSEESTKKGGVIRAFFGPLTLYGITDPEDALTVSNLCLEKPFTYMVLEILLKKGLVTADVHTWKKNRKLLDPAFNHQVLVGLLDIFNSQARRLVDHLSKEEGKPFDHEFIVRMNSLETICMTAFGANAEEFSQLQEKFLPKWDTVREISGERLCKIWLLSDLIYSFSSKKKKQDHLVGIMSKLADTIIQKKLNGMKNEAITGAKEDHISTFIRTLLKAANEGKLTQEEVRSEIDTMIGAGHETTASTIVFVLTQLGSHPEVQEKAYKELIEVVGNSDRNIEKEDLAQLTYLEAILKETLRLYPVIPVIGRQLDRDIKLKNCTLKANRSCFLSLHGILRDKMWGPDRHQFRPDRWFEKDTLPNQKYYMPFSSGRRFCIGKNYAMMSMKIVLAHVLRQYKITSDVSKLVIVLNIVVRPASGHYISIQKREDIK